MMGNTLLILTSASSLGLAWNIGANNAAAEMGPAYGAGVRSRRQAVVLIAIFCTLGAVTAGHRVVYTIGHRLIGERTLSANPGGALIVTLCALLVIGLANLLRAPISTAHAVVGGTVGLGVLNGATNLPLVATIVGWWVATPLASLLVSYLLGRFLYRRLLRAVAALGSEHQVHQAVAWGVTLSGCWMAFSAGSNSLAKAMGPAVGAGVFQPLTGAALGGLAMAAGALVIGGRVMSTVGKEITSLCPLCAVLVEVLSASILFTASRFGMPVSLTEIVTCSVIGLGLAANGVKSTADNYHVRRILVLWPAVPLVTAALAVGLQLVAR
jgi:PiT family inorganic phosphate transporter/sulfate permease